SPQTPAPTTGPPAAIVTVMGRFGNARGMSRWRGAPIAAGGAWWTPRHVRQVGPLIAGDLTLASRQAAAYWNTPMSRTSNLDLGRRLSSDASCSGADHWSSSVGPLGRAASPVGSPSW